MKRRGLYCEVTGQKVVFFVKFVLLHDNLSNFLLSVGTELKTNRVEKTSNPDRVPYFHFDSFLPGNRSENPEEQRQRRRKQV